MEIAQVANGQVSEIFPHEIVNKSPYRHPQSKR